jgi:two-component system chemotaxis response regulator CheY
MSERKKRVLVVDDAMFMRKVLGDILARAGYEVCGEASNADTAVRLYKELQPDLVTLDIVMPGASGLECARSLLAQDPKAKIIMVSALGQESLIKEASDIGTAGFIVKPFKQNLVVDTLNGVLGA